MKRKWYKFIFSRQIIFKAQTLILPHRNETRALGSESTLEGTFPSETVGAKLEQQKLEASHDDDDSKSQDEELGSDAAQQKYFEDLVDNMKFSSEEEDDQDGHLIKNAAQYLSYRPPEKKGSNKNDVN